MATACPTTPISARRGGGLLGYGLYAGEREEVSATLKTEIIGSATYPNVVMTLGGLIARLDRFLETEREFSPTLLTIA